MKTYKKELEERADIIRKHLRYYIGMQLPPHFNKKNFEKEVIDIVKCVIKGM